MRVINIGHNNAIAVGKVVAIIHPDSKPAKRLREQAEREGRLIDATNGRRTRSIIIMDSNHLILSSINPQTIIQRINEIKG